MKIKTLKTLLTTLIFVCHNAFATDAPDEESRVRAEIYEAKSIFKAITKEEATPETILDFVTKAHDDWTLDSSALGYAVEIYSLTSRDTAPKKRDLILGCAKKNPKNLNALFQCAKALEPSQESIDIYEKMMQNSENNLTYRLVSADRMVRLGLFPDLILNVLYAGATSSNFSQKRFADELRTKLIKTDSENAKELLKKLDEILKAKRVSEASDGIKETVKSSTEIPEEIVNEKNPIE